MNVAKIDQKIIEIRKSVLIKLTSKWMKASVCLSYIPLSITPWCQYHPLQKKLNTIFLSHHPTHIRLSLLIIAIHKDSHPPLWAASVEPFGCFQRRFCISNHVSAKQVLSDYNNYSCQLCSAVLWWGTNLPRRRRKTKTRESRDN